MTYNVFSGTLNPAQSISLLDRSGFIAIAFRCLINIVAVLVSPHRADDCRQTVRFDQENYTATATANRAAVRRKTGRLTTYLNQGTGLNSPPIS